MSLPLKGRTAIITGACGGIGRAVALGLSSLGANLVLGDLNQTHINNLASHINNNSNNSGTNPSKAIAVHVDVSIPSSVKSLFDAAESNFSSSPHILLTCAGVADPKAPTVAETSFEQWNKIFNINTLGTFLCCQQAASRMVRGGGGRIITVSSSLVESPRPRFGGYISSKAAVEAMTKTLAKELKGSGITANCIAPGPIGTEFLFNCFVDEEGAKTEAEKSPMGRLGQPEDVAAVVNFLATDDAEWINGQVIRVNGGSV